MSEKPILFDLPDNQADDKIAAALLTVAACSLMNQKDPSERMALKRTAHIYHSILHPDKSLGVWEKLDND